MPARDPTASPHIPSTNAPGSRRTSVQHNGPIKDIHDPHHSNRPSSPGSSALSNPSLHQTLSKSLGTTRSRRESMTGLTGTSKGKKRGGWYNLASDDNERAGDSGVTFETGGDIEDGSPPSQNSLTAAAIRDRTLNLAASLASYGSSGMEESQQVDSGEDSIGRPFGGTRLSRILDSRVDLTKQDQTSPSKDMYSKELLSTGSSPDGRLGSSANGPSALSLMLGRSNGSPGRSDGTSPSKPKSDLRMGGGTDIQATGANGIVGLLDIDAVAKRNKEESSPGSSVGQETPRPGNYRALASLSSSSQTIRPSGPVARNITPVMPIEDEDIVQGSSKTSETTPLLHTIRETSRSRSPPRKSSRIDVPNKQGESKSSRNDYSSTNNGNGKAHDEAEPAEPAALKQGRVQGLVHSVKSSTQEALGVVRKSTWKDVGRAVVMDPLSNVPAVILGLMLNVLDGVSYGMIT
jgi:hypothetical protein